MPETPPQPDTAPSPLSAGEGVENWQQVAERMREALSSAANALNAVSPMVTIAGLGDLTEEQQKTFRNRSAVFNTAKQIVKDALTLRALSQPPATEQCERCQGNGEIVKNWDDYLHPEDRATEEASVTECPDCDGTGHIDASPPATEQISERIKVPLPAGIDDTPSIRAKMQSSLIEATAKGVRNLAQGDEKSSTLDTARGATEQIRREVISPNGYGCIKPDTDKQVFFYEQDFYVLSNFSAFQVRWMGIDFATSEHVYHWEKFNGDASHHPEIQREIRFARSAHDAFKIAEKYRASRRTDWDRVKLNIMSNILRLKVTQHEYVRRKLLATGQHELIEDSWRDDFWGWGPNRDGQNMLGKLWMEVRAELRALAATEQPLALLQTESKA